MIEVEVETDDDSEEVEVILTNEDLSNKLEVHAESNTKEIPLNKIPYNHFKR